MRPIAILAVFAAFACGDDDSTPAEPDARIVSLECDAAAQSCPAMQKCNPTGPVTGPWDGTTCVDIAATGSSPGTPCFNAPDASDTCDETSMCLQPGTGEGACTPYCANNDDCNDTERCVLYDDAVGLQLCSARCDLAAPDCPLFFECVDARAGPACVPFVMRDLIPR